MSDELLQKLKAGTLNTKTIIWPGTDCPVAIRVLNEQDQLEASVAVDNIFSTAKIRVAAENIESYEAEKNDQLLFRAIVDPVTKKPVAPSMEKFRTLLIPGVREPLLEEIFAWQEECSPSPYTDSDKYDTLLEAVKKNAEVTLTNLTSISLAKRLIRSLAAAVCSLQTANGSTSLP